MLEVRGLRKRFGGVEALAGVDLVFPDQGIYGIIGPNGSGKSTLFNVISGFYRPDAGAVLLDGRRLSDLGPHRVARTGVVRTFQLSRAFAGLTVRENLLVAAPDRIGDRPVAALFARRAWQRQEQALRAEADAILDRVGLSHQADTPAALLSYGQSKLLELARALMTRPRVLLLDEPTAGVNPTLVDKLAALVRSIAADGRLVVLIEHNMPFVMGLCDQLSVLDRGTVLSSGTPAAVRADERVLQAYLGEGPGDA
jgi:ABC-type branched-subunit amino acid transport system ATPase component